MSLANKVVLITGASQGIGACLARAVHARGASCVLVARSSDKLQALCDELAGERVVAVTADVTMFVLRIAVSQYDKAQHYFQSIRLGSLFSVSLLSAVAPITSARWPLQLPRLGASTCG
jgi:NAD(P)-dependent dehydrogenase (short-subunit alcohol dehydrogenase family)